MRSALGDVLYYTVQEFATFKMGLLETVEIMEAVRWIKMKEDWISAYKWPAMKIYYAT